MIVSATALGMPRPQARRDRVVLVAELGHVVGRDADQRVVVDAVVLALELHDLLAAGVGPGDAHRVHRRLGAGHRHARLVDPAGQLADELHRPDLVLGRQAEADALAHPLVDVVVDPRRRRGRGSPGRSPSAGRRTRCRRCPRPGRPCRDRRRSCPRPTPGSSSRCRRASTASARRYSVVLARRGWSGGVGAGGGFGGHGGPRACGLGRVTARWRGTARCAIRDGARPSCHTAPASVNATFVPDGREPCESRSRLA